MSGAVAASFSYEALDADLAAALRAEAEAIRRHVARGTEAMLATGRALLGVKSRLQHGTFVAWVQSELAMSARSAQTMMRSAEIAAENEKFSLLQPSVALKLAAPSVPPEVRSAFVERAAGGERVAVAAVDAELRRRRDERAEAERLAAEAALPKRTRAAREARKRKEEVERAAWEKKQAEEARQGEDGARELAAILHARLPASEWQRVKELLRCRHVHDYRYQSGVGEYLVVRAMTSLGAPTSVSA